MKFFKIQEKRSAADGKSQLIFDINIKKLEINKTTGGCILNTFFKKKVPSKLEIQCKKGICF